MENKSFISKIGSFYDHMEEYLLIGSLAFNVLLVFVQVIMRLLHSSLTWSEELARYIFIWQIWLGASTALKYNEHIRVTLIFSFLKNKKVQAFISLLADLIWFLFCGYMVVNGYQLMQSMAARHAVSSGMGLPLTYVYSVFPIASILVCIRLLGVLWGDVKKMFGHEPDELERGGVNE